MCRHIDFTVDCLTDLITMLREPTHEKWYPGEIYFWYKVPLLAPKYMYTYYEKDTTNEALE